ncbi:MAG TPA: hypothetical protein VHM01_21835 [Alphaproteobacteria bacterium]|nr:hypothetical protein [Alphaproteobacteria bacterium]
MTAALHALPSDRLPAVSRFAKSLRHVSWFAAVGQALSADERREAHDYLAAIGFPEARIEAVGDWRAAESATRDARWSRAWWDAEEHERARLLRGAGKQQGEHALLTALSRVTLEASNVVLGAASIATSRNGVADPALARVAAGAATQAAYQAGLALAAEAGDAHPFAIKFRLFAAGRWPLGLIDHTFHVF